MSRRRHLPIATLGLLVSVGALILSRPWQAQSAEAGTFPTRVQAVADEFRFSLSRSRVPAGRVTIELANFGEDAHNFKLRRVGGTHVYTIGKTLPQRGRRRRSGSGTDDSGTGAASPTTRRAA